MRPCSSAQRAHQMPLPFGRSKMPRGRGLPTASAVVGAHVLRPRITRRWGRRRPERATQGSMRAGRYPGAQAARWPRGTSPCEPPRALVTATRAAEVAEAEGLLRQVEAIARRARAYETQAASAGDLRAALLALREERATVALAARMTGRLDGGEAPAEPFRPIVWNSFDPETGEEIVFDPWKVFPDPPPPPDPRKVIAERRAASAARDGCASSGADGNAHPSAHWEPVMGSRGNGDGRAQ